MSALYAYALIAALAAVNAAWAYVAIRASRKAARRYWAARLMEVVK